MERFKGIKVREIYPAAGPPFPFPVFDINGSEMMAIKPTESKKIFLVGFENSENPGDLDFIEMTRRDIKELVNNFLKTQAKTYSSQRHSQS